jgi:hypothetical protein
MVCDIFGLELNVGDGVLYPENDGMHNGIITSLLRHWGSKHDKHVELQIPSGDTRIILCHNVINCDAAELAFKDFYAENYV